MVGYLLGFREYLDSAYADSVFDRALDGEKLWNLHLHGHRLMVGTVVENSTYDIKVRVNGEKAEPIPKLEVKFLYPAELHDSVAPLLKFDKKIKALQLKPIVCIGERHFVKNKSLYPLMKKREVVFFTLLEGEMIRGVIADFSRFDVTVHMKGGIPLTILRHSVYDLRNKQGRCFLKSLQEKHRDWKRSDLFVTTEQQ
jgi:hypothetical protein